MTFARELLFSFILITTTPSFWTQTLEGPPNSPYTLLPELHRYKDTARCALLGA